MSLVGICSLTGTPLVDCVRLFDIFTSLYSLFGFAYGNACMVNVRKSLIAGKREGDRAKREKERAESFTFVLTVFKKLANATHPTDAILKKREFPPDRRCTSPI